jgi:hypothetical protein
MIDVTKLVGLYFQGCVRWSSWMSRTRGRTQRGDGLFALSGWSWSQAWSCWRMRTGRNSVPVRPGWPPTGIRSRGRSCRRLKSCCPMRHRTIYVSHHECLGTRATIGVKIRIRARVPELRRTGFREPARFSWRQPGALGRGRLRGAQARGAGGEPGRCDRDGLPGLSGSPPDVCRSKIVNGSRWRQVATKLVRVPSRVGWRGGVRWPRRGWRARVCCPAAGRAATFSA